jgi:ABC-type glycerol-3-phosphate transport system substrate-binding protein
MDTDVFCDLNAFIESDPDFNLDGCNKVVMDSGVYKGKRYVMPISYQNNIMITTEEALAAAKMSREDTQSFDAIASGIKRYLDEHASTRGVYSMRNYRESLYFPWCGLRLMDYETKTLNIDGAETKKLVDAYKGIYMQDLLLKDLRGESYTTLLYPEEAIPAIKSGEILFFNAMDFRIFVVCKAVLEHDGYTPVYLPFPAVNGKIIGDPNEMAVILNTSPNKLNAYRLMKILLSEQIQGGIWPDVVFGYTPVLNSAVETQLEFAVRMAMANNGAYEGKRGVISVTLDDLREYMDMVINIDDCRLPEVGPFYLFKHMEPYFKSEDTYENCLNKMRNWLELYLTE